MKTVLGILIAVLANSAQAQYSQTHQVPFQACEEINGMAILNKDQKPYWVSGKADPKTVQSCYQDLKNFASQATPKMINQLEQEYKGQIRIFNDDASFANFIQDNSDAQEDSFQIQNASFGSIITTLKPGQSADFFQQITQ